MADRNFTKNLLIADPIPGKFNWYYSWYRNSSTMDAVSYQTLRGNTVTNGMVVSNAGGLYVNIAAGVVSIGGTSFDVAAVTNLAVVAASIEDEQYNFVYVDNTGTVISSTIAPLGEFAILSVVDCDVSNVLRLSDLRNIKAEDVTVLPTVENDCINGFPQVWQRSEDASFVSDRIYAADRFYSDSPTGRIRKVYEVFDAESMPCIRVTTTAATMHLSTRLPDKMKYSGKTIQVSFIAKEGQGNGCTLALLIVNGDATTAYNADTYVVFGQSLSRVTASFTVPDLSATAMPDSGSFNQFIFTVAGAVDNDFTITDIQIYVSDTQLPVRRRSYEEELALCLPYYERCTAQMLYNTIGSTGTGRMSAQFKAVKAVTPVTVVLVATNPAGGSVAGSDQYGATVTTSGTSGGFCNAEITAEAEI